MIDAAAAELEVVPGAVVAASPVTTPGAAIDSGSPGKRPREDGPVAAPAKVICTVTGDLSPPTAAVASGKVWPALTWIPTCWPAKPWSQFPSTKVSSVATWR